MYLPENKLSHQNQVLQYQSEPSHHCKLHYLPGKRSPPSILASLWLLCQTHRGWQYQLLSNIFHIPLHAKIYSCHLVRRELEILLLFHNMKHHTDYLLGLQTWRCCGNELADRLKGRRNHKHRRCNPSTSWLWPSLGGLVLVQVVSV